MPTFEVDREPIYVFVLDHAHVFKHYFELNELFDALSDYYDGDEYRFEVPAHEWGRVASILRARHYEPIVVEDVSEFVVVKEQYTPHADILRNSVENWSRRGHNFFLLKDPLAVEQAVEEHGATPVSETDMAAGL